jgi:hypothetical protein
VSPPLFIKTIGSAGDAVPPNWLSHEGWQNRLASVVFPKYPRSVERGSRLVYYAAGRQCFCAVMEVTGDEAQETGEERWRWKLPLRPLIAIPADSFAPTLNDVGFDPLRVRRQSHIRLTVEEYEHITAAIVAAAARSTSL